ncbi:MAG: hypothetical protein WC626_03350 [Methanoregula sp.]
MLCYSLEFFNEKFSERSPFPVNQYERLTSRPRRLSGSTTVKIVDTIDILLIGL